MNRSCNGTYYDDISQYRCLMNGSFVKMEDPVEDKSSCPVCCRRVGSVTRVSKSEQKTEKVNYIKCMDSWVERSREEVL